MPTTSAAGPRHVHAHAGRGHRRGAVPRAGPHQVVGTLTSPEVERRQAGRRAQTRTPSADTRCISTSAGAPTTSKSRSACATARCDGSPKLGIVNHGGYGLVDDNVTYRVRGSHFFTENGSEIGRFSGNLAGASDGTDGDDDGLPIPTEKGYAGHPLNIGQAVMGSGCKGAASMSRQRRHRA